MVSAIIRTYFIKKPVRVHTVLSVFTLRCLHKLDLDIMEACVKEVEAVESHITCYPERQVMCQCTCTCLGSD